MSNFSGLYKKSEINKAYKKRKENKVVLKQLVGENRYWNTGIRISKKSLSDKPHLLPSKYLPVRSQQWKY